MLLQENMENDDSIHKCEGKQNNHQSSAIFASARPRTWFIAQFTAVTLRKVSSPEMILTQSTASFLKIMVQISENWT